MELLDMVRAYEVLLEQKAKLEDAEANICHYCLHKLHMTPSAFFGLERNERAFLIASIEVRLEDEKEAEKKRKHAGKKGRRR